MTLFDGEISMSAEQATLIAAATAAAVSLWISYLTGRRASQERQRQLLADAFEAVVEYREFPFIVRRRSGDDPPGERRRISGELSAIQARLNSYLARLQVEAPRVGSCYRRLVEETRRVAGGEIRKAWDLEPITVDAQVHAPDVNLSELAAVDREYVLAASDHFAWLPTWLRRLGRWVSSKRPWNKANGGAPTT